MIQINLEQPTRLLRLLSTLDELSAMRVFAVPAGGSMDVQGMRKGGIVTGEAYHGWGLAALTRAHLIKPCEESGSATHWDCAKFNAGSALLARKLGFQNERAYKVLAWFKEKG